MTPKPRRNLRRSRRIRSKACTKVTATPFPLPARSPHTPTRDSTRYLDYHPDQTHPASDPFYPSPIIGLRFNKTNHGGAIAREGAVIFGEKVEEFEFLGHKYYEVKRAYKSGVGFCPGSTFRPIKVGLEGGDVSIPKFDPEFFQSTWSLRRRVNGLEEPTGITLKELQQLCIQCERCGNFVTQTTQACHECFHGAMTNQAASPESDNDIFRSPEFRLDAIGKDAYSLGGVTIKEFEDHFSMCINCKRIFTASGCSRHTHSCSHFQSYDE